MKLSFDSGEELLITRIKYAAFGERPVLLNEQDVKTLNRLFKQLQQSNVEPQHFEVLHDSRSRE